MEEVIVLNQLESLALFALDGDRCFREVAAELRRLDQLVVSTQRAGHELGCADADDVVLFVRCRLGGAACNETEALIQNPVVGVFHLHC
ncbi:hypothetical protein D3C73_1447240 [compost metagenome]